MIVNQAQGMTDQDRDVNRIIEKLEAQTLESRKRLESIRDVEQENLKFNRVLKKLYNELTREREIGAQQGAQRGARNCRFGSSRKRPDFTRSPCQIATEAP